jgi:hypothetical protein
MVGGFAELPFDFPPQSLFAPWSAVAPTQLLRTENSMCFSGIVTYPDDNVQVEGAYRYGVGRLERVAHSRLQVFRVVLLKHVGPPPGNLKAHRSWRCLGNIPGTSGES